jgi:hypothetical protein
LKAGQSQLAGFESRPAPTRQFSKAARANSPILKASQSQLADFESRQEPFLPFSKAFRKFKNFSR